MYRRHPRGSVSRTTIGRFGEMGYVGSSDIERKWVARCDAHLEDKFFDTRREAQTAKSQEFCATCGETVETAEYESTDTGEVEIIPPVALDLSPKPATAHITSQEAS
uniref:Uncharacterized protein n=1 Tax=Micrococcus phage Kurnik TaxID=3092208 RepID=A0AAU6R6A9_9CAUD